MKSTEEVSQKSKPKRPPARTPEARESQMIALAMDAAEEQMRRGTASSQVITHFLKLGSVIAKKELALLEQEILLKQAKTKAIADSKDIKELYAQAMIAMSKYSGNRGDEDYD